MEVSAGTELRRHLDPNGQWDDPRWLVVAGLRDGKPEGFSVCSVTGRWAFLTLAQFPAGSPSGFAYLLHRETVLRLIGRGVDHLHGGPSMVLRPHAYFLARLGYRAVNLRWVGGREHRRSSP
ncbi:MAG: hypothetical protein ACJ762_18535 [Solirubrobacteraceae bacterium]